MATHVTIGVAPDVSGSPVPVDFVTLNTADKRQTMTISDPLTSDMDAKVTSVDPGPTDNGLVVRPIRGARTNKHFVSAATNNATSLKATAGVVYRVHVYNNAGYPVYVKLYNKATTPAPVSDAALLICVVACQSGFTREYVLDDAGAAFSTGIGYAVVKGITDIDNTAVALSDCIVGIEWL